MSPSLQNTFESVKLGVKDYWDNKAFSEQLFVFIGWSITLSLFLSIFVKYLDPVNSTDLRNILLTTIATVSVFIAYKKFRLDNIHNVAAKIEVEKKEHIPEVREEPNMIVTAEISNFGNRPIKISSIPVGYYRLYTHQGEIRSIDIVFTSNWGVNKSLKPAEDFSKRLAVASGFAVDRIYYIDTKNDVQHVYFNGATLKLRSFSEIEKKAAAVVREIMRGDKAALDNRRSYNKEEFESMSVEDILDDF